MDQQAPQVQPQPTPVAAQPTPPPVTKRGGGFFHLLGKIFLFILIAAGLLLGGYYLGTMGKTSTATTTPTPTVTAVASPTSVPASPTAASQTTKTVKAGLANNTNFKPYSIDVPTGWIDARETTVTANIDKLTLTKSGYSVTILQAATDGGGCIYPGDKPSEMSQTFTDSSDINGKSGQFKRSWNQKGATQTISYTICQKAADNSYGSLTTFGRIDVVSPNPADSGTLIEIDGMIASMTTQ